MDGVVDYALVAFLIGGVLASLSITLGVIGVLHWLSTEQKAPVEKGKGQVWITRRMACSVCGAHSFIPVDNPPEYLECGHRRLPTKKTGHR
jgi:hypothetical protein